MKRFTIRNSDGSVSQPTNLDWAAALERLAAYEDTGLTPEEISRKSAAGEDNYVIRVDGLYYAGWNTKYSDMYNLSPNAEGAKRMSLEEAEKRKTGFERCEHHVELEKYDARKYLEECLSKIIRYDEERREGKDCGYAIKNYAQDASRYLKQIC